MKRAATGPGPSRFHSVEAKLELVQAYQAWVVSGERAYSQELVAKTEELGCSIDLPRELHQKMLETGNLEHRQRSGRPTKFPPALWEAVDTMIREARDHQKVASPGSIREKLKEMGFDEIPCERTIEYWKKEQGFAVHQVKVKPFLTMRTMALRLEFATNNVSRDWNRWIWVDEKWFDEIDVTQLAFEARPGSPLRGEHKFRAAAAETKTQKQKIMFLVVVSPKGPVCCLELDWRSFSDSKGINSKYWVTKVDEIHQAAVALLGSDRPIDIVLDRAPSHVSKLTMQVLSQRFRKVIVQPPSSPDFNMLDAGVFPFMERECNRLAAHSKESIRAAVEATWPLVNPEFCSRVAARVRRNMEAAIELQGGNFYEE